MFLGDRHRSEPYYSNCSRCGGQKVQDTSRNGSWIDHQVDDCLFSLRMKNEDFEKKNQELKNENQELRRRIELLEMNPLDRLAREV